MALSITAYKSNTVSSVSGTTFTSNGTPFVSGDVGRCLVITSGSAIGQMRKIVGFTSSTVVTVDYAWNVSPFANEINDQTGVAFVEVNPAATDGWTMSTYLDDIDDTTNINKAIAPVAGHEGGVYEQVGTNVITIAAGAFLYDRNVTFLANCTYMDITPTGYVRWGDISETGYVYNSCNIIDTSIIWSTRQWTNSASGDAGDFHMYGGTITMTYQGNATEFSNPLWSFFRSQTAIYQLVGVRAYGEFGMRIQGDNSVLLDFYSSGGDDSGYRAVHPLPVGLFKNVGVTNSKGAIYWRVSDGNLVNVYNVSIEDLGQQAVYQTNAGVDAVFNWIGFEADQFEALPNVLNVTTSDPDGTFFLKNPINTSFIDSSLSLITDSAKRVIWDETDTVVDNQTKTTGVFDQYNAVWWEIATTPTGLKDLVDGTTHTPYFQSIASYKYKPASLSVTGRSPSSEKLTGGLELAVTVTTKATVDAYTSITTGEHLFDRSKSWDFDNWHLAYPSKDAGAIIGAGSNITYAGTLVLDDDAVSAFAVNTGLNEITINTGLGSLITRVGATEAVSTGEEDQIIIAFPGGIQDNDVAYIAVGHAESDANAWNTPAGWVIPTSLTEVATGGTPASVPGLSIFRRVLSGDSGSVTITNAGVNVSGIVAQMIVYRGVDTTTPEDVVSVTSTGASGDPDPASITTANNNAVVLSFAFMDDGDQTAPTPPASYTAILDTATLDGAGTGE